jgi:sugar transferase (PEP-CTERM/EpsH1 system associated)
MAARHEVDVFTLADDARDLAYRDELSSYCHRLTVARVHPKLSRLRSLPYLLTGVPLTVPYFYSRKLQADVLQAVSAGSYDRIFVYCSAMAQYVQSVNLIPIVMDLVDVDSDKWTQYAAYSKLPYSAIYRREGRTLQAYERTVCEKATCVLVSTEREAQLTRQIAPTARVHVLPNGVDTEYFKPAAEQASEPSVIFTGDMSYFPNEEAVVYFAHQVLPLIRRRLAGARFLIVGRNPGRRVEELRQIEGVEVTGFVPDVRTWLSKARVAVAPFTIAAGIQNKILEAMAFGLPVVATPRAAQGLSCRVAEMVDTGDTPEQLASKVAELLQDSEFARRKGLDGRRRVAEDYMWDAALERLLQLLESPASTELPRIGAF